MSMSLHVKIGDELSAPATPPFILTNVGYMEGETFYEGFSPVCSRLDNGRKQKRKGEGENV